MMRGTIKRAEGGSPLFCVGNAISITSAEVDHGKDVSSAYRLSLSKCPRSLIKYFNSIHQHEIAKSQMR
jgi:hypothetical protein